MPNFLPFGVDSHDVNKAIHMIWEFEDTGCTPLSNPISLDAGSEPISSSFFFACRKQLGWLGYWSDCLIAKFDTNNI